MFCIDYLKVLCNDPILKTNLSAQASCVFCGIFNFFRCCCKRCCCRMIDSCSSSNWLQRKVSLHSPLMEVKEKKTWMDCKIVDDRGKNCGRPDSFVKEISLESNYVKCRSRTISCHYIKIETLKGANKRRKKMLRSSGFPLLFLCGSISTSRKPHEGPQ